MITAQTVQLLDANNKNISPAVNIESLYFEGTISSTSPDTYRFGLRDKLVVGGKLEQLSATHDGSTSLRIPYIYASRAFNSSSGVWQIDSDYYDMAEETKLFIDAVCINKYATIANVSSNFLDLMGNNAMKGAIKMNNGIIYTKDGIQTSNSKAYVQLSESGQNVSIYGSNDVKIVSDSGSGKTVVATDQSGAHIEYNVTDQNSSVSVNAHGVSISSQMDAVVKANDITMNADTKLSLSSDSDIDVTAENGNININA